MIGIDITSIDRIKKMYEKFGIKAYEKFLNTNEIELIKKPETAAGFWAAKEAASKALGTGIGEHCAFHDIKISKGKLGNPKIKYKKEVRKRFGIKKSHLSITHDAGFAIAVVINVLKKD
ncbi:MAG: holo-ACP synthase [Arcobacter sp.]|uniref:holo-ACP synthase n=1 Tax=Arcobacter sp. TaxID=1872629 RepID=UPI003CFCB28C